MKNCNFSHRILAFGIFTSALLIASATAAQTKMSPWLSIHGLNDFIKSAMKRSHYPDRIECRHEPKNKSGVALRLRYQPIDQNNRPFHKWNWFVDWDSKKQERLAALKRSGRLDLKYRIVNEMSYTDPDGVLVTCAIAYR